MNLAGDVQKRLQFECSRMFGCGTVANDVVYGFFSSPSWRPVTLRLDYPPCACWCSGGLFKPLIRKIISANKCATLSRWLIIKWGSLFPWRLWLISTCVMLNQIWCCRLFLIYSEPVQYSCLKIPIDVGLVCFVLWQSENCTSPVELTVIQWEEEAEWHPNKGLAHSMLRKQSWETATSWMLSTRARRKHYV